VGGRAGRAGREDAGSGETFATTEGLRPFEGGRGPRLRRGPQRRGGHRGMCGLFRIRVVLFGNKVKKNTRQSFVYMTALK
jgi:hypothetical protein